MLETVENRGVCSIDVCWLSAQARRKEGGGVKTEQIVA